MIRVLCLETEISNTKAILPIMVDGETLVTKDKSDMLICRAKMDILKQLNLFQYDSGFFKYGLLLLKSCNDGNKKYDIILHPKMSLDNNKFNHFGKIQNILKNQKSNIEPFNIEKE